MKGYRSERIQERKDPGKEGSRRGIIQERKEPGKERNSRMKVINWFRNVNQSIKESNPSETSKQRDKDVIFILFQKYPRLIKDKNINL